MERLPSCETVAEEVACVFSMLEEGRPGYITPAQLAHVLTEVDMPGKLSAEEVRAPVPRLGSANVLTRVRARDFQLHEFLQFTGLVDVPRTSAEVDAAALIDSMVFPTGARS